MVSPDENNRRAAAFRKLASTARPAGTNVVIVSRKPNIIDAFGKDWFEIKEGEATIFKPDGAAYKVAARVQMDEWPRIAATAKQRAASTACSPGGGANGNRKKLVRPLDIPLARGGPKADCRGGQPIKTLS